MLKKPTAIPLSTLPQLATTANTCHQHFERLASDALDFAYRAGKALQDAKRMLPHGGFEVWVQENVSFSPRTARSYMRIASNWSTIRAKRDLNPSLSLRDAIGLLTTSKPQEPQNGNALPFCLSTRATLRAREARMDADFEAAMRHAESIGIADIDGVTIA
ncbi:DUF3102 domain-containing protein [Schlesneria sp. T3-172]|uniref:DUF3102 domain-containing protein n=1 Tax=Schlesneria sphaerica TaxID=3373610 RepID=UPI0037CBB736